MKKKIITVSREFGSGGRTIGKQLAERLGMDYYDKELVRQVADQTGFDPSFVEDQGEHAPGKSRLSYLLNHQGVPGFMNGLSAADFLWCIQRNVILDLAEKGPCVIVGRAADFILKDREDAFHIFVHASLAFRADRILRLYGERKKSPAHRLQDKHKQRRVNYKHYTGREWGMAQNYHLCLDSGVLGVERCVDLVAGLVKEL